MLVAMALVGDPIAGITQAGQHPSAGQAVPAVLAAVADRIDTHLLLERALAVAEAIPDDWQRGRALAGIAAWLAGAAPADPALIERALAVAETIPDDKQRSEALAGIAERLAGVDPADRGADRPGPGRGRHHPRRWNAPGRWPASPRGWLVPPPPTRR